MLRTNIAAALTLTLTLTACDSEKSEIKGGTDTEAVTEADSEGATDAVTEGATEAGTDGGAASEGATEAGTDGGAATEAGTDTDTDGGGDTEIGSDDGAEEGEQTSTPLVLAFRGEAVQFNTLPGRFALTGAAPVASDWPTSTTPWLALDRDGDGEIDGGGELFGSATVLQSGDTAPNGFVALRELDSNNDGKLDATDPAWQRLLVWSDVDGDRKSTATELSPVTARGLVALELGYAVDRRCDARANCEVERAGFSYRDSTGRELRGVTIDVHLRLR